jgi:hypothetical protein
MIYLIASQEPRYLVGLTYVWSITKFELRKGTKKILLAAQVPQGHIKGPAHSKIDSEKKMAS